MAAPQGPPAREWQSWDLNHSRPLCLGRLFATAGQEAELGSGHFPNVQGPGASEDQVGSSWGGWQRPGSRMVGGCGLFCSQALCDYIVGPKAKDNMAPSPQSPRREVRGPGGPWPRLSGLGPLRALDSCRPLGGPQLALASLPLPPSRCFEPPARVGGTW